MKARVINEGKQRTFAMVFDTGDEVLAAWRCSGCSSTACLAAPPLARGGREEGDARAWIGSCFPLPQPAPARGGERLQRRRSANA